MSARIDQMMREYCSLMKSTSTKDYRRIIQEKKAELERMAEEEGINIDDLYKKIMKVVNNFGIKDKVISRLKICTSNPLTDELIEALLLQFVDTGEFQIRTVKLKSDIPRGEDSPDFQATRKEAELDSLRVGLTIFVNNIRKGNIDKVSSRYYKKITEIGIEKLERYLQTGNAEGQIREFLQEVYENCYDFNTELIGDRQKAYASLQSCIEKDAADFRFYINMPSTSEAVKFVRDYQIECQKAGISYCMKAFKNSGTNAKDVSIFYSSYEDFDKKLQIIKTLLEKYPNIQIGTPPSACVEMPGIPKIGICHNGVNAISGTIIKNQQTYNDYINSLAYNALIEVFGDYISGDFQDLTDYVSRFKKGDLRNPFTNQLSGNSVINKISEDEKEYVKRKISSLLSDPLKRKVFIQLFKRQMQIFHNRNQGYPADWKSNVALDVWYIDSKKEPERTIPLQQVVENATVNGMTIEQCTSGCGNRGYIGIGANRDG